MKKLVNQVINEIFRQMTITLTLALDVPVRPMDAKGLSECSNSAPNIDEIGRHVYVQAKLFMLNIYLIESGVLVTFPVFEKLLMHYLLLSQVKMPLLSNYKSVAFTSCKCK